GVTARSAAASNTNARAAGRFDSSGRRVASAIAARSWPSWSLGPPLAPVGNTAAERPVAGDLRADVAFDATDGTRARRLGSHDQAREGGQSIRSHFLRLAILFALAAPLLLMLGRADIATTWTHRPRSSRCVAPASRPIYSATPRPRGTRFHEPL